MECPRCDTKIHHRHWEGGWQVDRGSFVPSIAPGAVWRLKWLNVNLYEVGKPDWSISCTVLYHVLANMYMSIRSIVETVHCVLNIIYIYICYSYVTKNIFMHDNRGQPMFVLNIFELRLRLTRWFQLPLQSTYDMVPWQKKEHGWGGDRSLRRVKVWKQKKVSRSGCNAKSDV